MADENEQIHLDGDEARGGTTPGVTRYVLFASLGLITLIFAVILLWGRIF